MTEMDFSEALRRMKLGAKIHRSAWPKGTYLEYKKWPWAKTSKKIILKKEPTLTGCITGRLDTLSHDDLLAADWVDPAE